MLSTPCPRASSVFFHSPRRPDRLRRDRQHGRRLPRHLRRRRGDRDHSGCRRWHRVRRRLHLPGRRWCLPGRCSSHLRRLHLRCWHSGCCRTSCNGLHRRCHMLYGNSLCSQRIRLVKRVCSLRHWKGGNCRFIRFWCRHHVLNHRRAGYRVCHGGHRLYCTRSLSHVFLRTPAGET
jgi:hypothetical protein